MFSRVLVGLSGEGKAQQKESLSSSSRPPLAAIDATDGHLDLSS